MKITIECKIAAAICLFCLFGIFTYASSNYLKIPDKQNNEPVWSISSTDGNSIEFNLK